MGTKSKYWEKLMISQKLEPFALDCLTFVIDNGLTQKSSDAQQRDRIKVGVGSRISLCIARSMVEFFISLIIIVGQLQIYSYFKFIFCHSIKRMNMYMYRPTSNQSIYNITNM